MRERTEERDPKITAFSWPEKDVFPPLRRGTPEELGRIHYIRIQGHSVVQSGFNT